MFFTTIIINHLKKGGQSMDNEQKNLLFYFIEEVSSDIDNKTTLYQKQENLLSELEQIPKKFPDLKEVISRLSDSVVELCSEMKYKYFEYGITANDILNTHVLI